MTIRFSYDTALNSDYKVTMLGYHHSNLSFRISEVCILDLRVNRYAEMVTKFYPMPH